MRGLVPPPPAPPRLAGQGGLAGVSQDGASLAMPQGGGQGLPPVGPSLPGAPWIGGGPLAAAAGPGPWNAANLGAVPGGGLLPAPGVATGIPKAPAGQARLLQQAQRAQVAAAKAAAKAAALAAQAGLGGPQIGVPGGAGAAVMQGALGGGARPLGAGGAAVAALNAAMQAGGGAQLFPGARPAGLGAVPIAAAPAFQPAAQWGGQAVGQGAGAALKGRDGPLASGSWSGSGAGGGGGGQVVRQAPTQSRGFAP